MTPRSPQIGAAPTAPPATPATSATPPGGPVTASAPQPTVSVSLSSVDPPVVAEYAELTPDSTGPVVTALDERMLMSRLVAERTDAAEHEIAADGGSPLRFNQVV